MKINVEVDITPDEVKELFEGNMDVLQRSLIELFMRQMAQSTSPDPEHMSFWKSMSEQSSDMFEQYKKAMMGDVGEPLKHK